MKIELVVFELAVFELVVFELVWEIQPLCLFRNERAAANGEINTGAGFPLYIPQCAHFHIHPPIFPLPAARALS